MLYGDARIRMAVHSCFFLTLCWCNRAQCLEYLGSHFRVVLGLPKSTPPLVVAEQLLEEYVFIHLNPRQGAWQ
jgi:hypothetical protein